MNKFEYRITQINSTTFELHKRRIGKRWFNFWRPACFWHGIFDDYNTGTYHECLAGMEADKIQQQFPKVVKYCI